ALEASETKKLIEGQTISDRLNLKGLRKLHFWDGGLFDYLGVQPLLRRYRFEDAVLRAHMQMYRELRLTDHNEPAGEFPQDLDFMVVSDAAPSYSPQFYDRWMSFWRLVSLPVDHLRMMYGAQIVSLLRVIQQQEQEREVLPDAGAYLQFDNTVGFVL